MKHLLLGALALSLASSASALDWSSVTNIANGAMVTVSSRFGNESQICDDNTGNGWQAIGHAHEKSNDFILIDLGEVKDFSDIEIWWEASHPVKYDIYVSADAVPYTLQTIDGIEMNVIDAAWLASHSPAASREFTANAGQDEINLPKMTGRYILVYALELNGNGTNYGSRVFEIKVGNTADTAPVFTSFDIPGMTWLGCEIDLAGAAKDQMGRVIADGITFSATGAGSIADGRFVPAAKGVVTLTATDGTVEISRDVLVLDLDQWVMGSATVTSDTGLGNAAALTDGGADPTANGAQYAFVEGEPQGDAEHWVLVDLGRPVTIDAIYATWEGASSNRYDVLVGEDPDNMTVVGSVDEPLAVKARQDWFYGKEMKQVRYVKIATHSNGSGYGLKLYELKVYGQTDYVQIPTRTAVYFEESFALKGRPVHVHTYLADQYGEPMAGDVTLTSDDGGFEPTDDATVYLFTPSHKGACVVKAECGDKSQQTDITCIADLEAYLMTDSNIKAVTSDLEHTEGAALYDGGADIESNGAIYQLVKEGSDEAADREAEHWVLVEFVGPMNIDAIYATWEGASASKYDVAVGNDPENLTSIHTVDEDHGVLARKDWFYGSDMKAVNFVKITTRKAASQYGTKLYDLKIYGERDIKPVSFTVDPVVRVDGVNRKLDVIYLDEALNLNAVLTDNFGEQMALEGNVAFTVNDAPAMLDEGVFVPEAEGVYTIKAICDGFDIDPVTVNVVDNANTLLYKHKNVSLELSGEHPLAAYRDVLMGGTHAGYKSIDVEGHDVTVTFAEPLALSALELKWDADCAASYSVSINDAGPIAVEGSASRVSGGDIRRLYLADNDAKVSTIRIHDVVAAEGATGAKLMSVAPIHREDGLILDEKTQDDLRNEGIDLGVDTVVAADPAAVVDVVNAQGMVVRRNVVRAEATEGLAPGIYVVGGDKVLVK